MLRSKLSHSVCQISDVSFILPLSFFEAKCKFFFNSRELMWFSRQSKLSLHGQSNFCCVPGQIKMAPPLGPMLAQFLSGLAAEFILFLNNLTDSFQQTLNFSTELDISLNNVSVVLLKFKSEELRMRLSFSAAQTLFNRDSFSSVTGFYDSSFGLLHKLAEKEQQSTTTASPESFESFRVILKNMLQLESYLFLLVNFYFFLCSCFAINMFSGVKMIDYLVFTKKHFSFALPLFTGNWWSKSSPGFSDSLLKSHNSTIGFLNLFLMLYKAVNFIYSGFSLSLCANKLNKFSKSSGASL